MYTRRRQRRLACGTAIVLVVVGAVLAGGTSTAGFGWAAVMAGLALAGTVFQDTRLAHGEARLGTSSNGRVEVHAFAALRVGAGEAEPHDDERHDEDPGLERVLVRTTDVPDHEHAY